MNCSRLARCIDEREKALRLSLRHDLHVPHRDSILHDLRRMTHNLDYRSSVATNLPKE